MNTNPLAQWLTTVQADVSGIGLLMATIFLVIGAYRYMAANGNPRQMEQGKSAMAAALIGYAVVIGANALLGIITSAVGG
jgi:hypothetical protein